MNIFDLIKVDVKADLTSAVEGARNLLAKLIGPGAQESGLIIGDALRDLRFRRQLRILTRAQEMLKDAGIEPKKVPLKFLAQLLENCWQEDDESMSEKWAALLANTAAAGDERNAIFPGILSQLTPKDAHVLEWAERGCPLSSRPVTFEKISVVKDEPDLGSAFPLYDFALSWDNLKRLGLVNGPSNPVQGLTLEKASISTLGTAFLKACRIEEKAR
jgi:hypothetical protein